MKPNFLNSITITFLLTISLSAKALDCKVYEPGCDQRFFNHYRALAAALDKTLKSNSSLVESLGEATETVYHGAWLQRYTHGLMIHLSQGVAFTPAKQESHEGSTFIVRFDSESAKKDRGQFFFQWRPLVTGIYDVDLFKSILISYPQNPSLLGWPQNNKIADSQLIELFRPHTETSPKNLSGGLAVIYAMFRLDQYIGLPLEQQFTRTLLRRNFTKGYVLAGMPDPNSSKLANGSNDGYANDVKFIYVFKTEKEPKGNNDTDRFAGGKKYRGGSWSIMNFDAGKEELLNRPKRGLLRK